MKTAIIGGNGFLGRKIAELLILDGQEVISVYNRNQDNIVAGSESISLEKFLIGKLAVNHIIFAAGGFRNSIADNIELNCSILYNLTKNYKHCRFIYVSSANVYGYPAETVKEDSPFFNPNNYGLSKLNGEFIVSGLPSYAIVRLVYLYGPGLDNGSFLPFIAKEAMEKGVISLYGMGDREQDYLHVSDAARLILKALFNGENETYLGATGKSFSNKWVAEMICEILGSNSCKVVLIPKDETSLSLYYDPSRTKKALKWEPQISMEDGLKDFLL